ncbi:hypothetical protein JW879_05475 [candidate division WOR-3 bacterium]|nr:hypothetical protein [candidate division WOR-3 bacterium]
MRKGLMVAVFLVTFLALMLRAEPWIYSADASLLVNGSTYSDNWVGGEVGTLAWKFLSNSMAEKQINPKMNNKNTLVLLFGQTYNQDIESKSWSSPLEADDKIDLESVLRFTLGWVLDPVIAGRMQSQFYDNRDPDNSRYVNPINLTESFGVARAIVKSEKQELIVRTGAALKQSIDREIIDPITSEKSTDISNEGGLELVTDLTTRFADERITYKSKLSVFEALFKKDGEAVGGETYWRYPDIDWENTLSGEITKYLTVNLYIQLLYDREVTEKPRYRQSIAVGLTYKFLTSP